MRRRRRWFISPEGFRELRHSCFLSQSKCADFLGVSLRTVRHWDAGRNRVPWSVVRILRLRRLGDLGALDDAWDGWTINRNGLFSPDGRKFEAAAMRHWWSQIDRARLWQEAYERGEIRGCGGKAPALTLQPEVWKAQVITEALPAPAPGAALLLTAFSRFLQQLDPVLIGADAGAASVAPRLNAISASLAATPGQAAVAVLPPRSGASPHPAATPTDSLPISCARSGEVAQSRGDDFASGCTLLRHGNLLSDCTADPPQTQAQPYVAVLPLHARSCASGPDSNTGLASNPEPRA